MNLKQLQKIKNIYEESKNIFILGVIMMMKSLLIYLEPKKISLLDIINWNSFN